MGRAGAFVGWVRKDLGLDFVGTNDVDSNGVEWLKVAGFGWLGRNFAEVGSTDFDFVTCGTMGDIFFHRRVHMGPYEMLPEGRVANIQVIPGCCSMSW